MKNWRRFLPEFVIESNRIEGIPTIREAEVNAHLKLLGSMTTPTGAALEEFVNAVAPGNVMRRRVGRDVQVGRHIAPRGGPDIESQLNSILNWVMQRVDPWQVHNQYEALHPFSDGNGRSGRALWAWQMIHQRDYALDLGFLHMFYYQTLQNWHTRGPTV